MKSLCRISACVLGLAACASVTHATLQDVSLTIIDRTTYRPITVQAKTVESIALTRVANRVKSINITFSLAGQSRLRWLTLTSRSQSLLRSKYDLIQSGIEQKRQVAITATARRAAWQYASNIDVWPLIVTIGPGVPPPPPPPTPTPTPPPTPTPTPEATPTPTPEPTPTPTPEPTPTPGEVVLDQLTGDFSQDALKVFDTSQPGSDAIDGAIRSVELVEQASALSIRVGFAESDESLHELSISGAEAEAVRAHFQALADVLRVGRSFWLSASAYPDSANPSRYLTALESAVVKIDVLPSRTGSGTIPNVALTVSPGSDALVIAGGVQTIGTQCVNGTVTLRISFFLTGDSNHHWLTFSGQRQEVFARFSSMVNSINSRWRFGLYAYSASSADGVFYEADMGVHTLILSIEPAASAALPGMTASASAGGTLALSGMPVRVIYFYYEASPYLWVQGTDADGNAGGLILTNAGLAFYDDVVSALQASDVMSSSFMGYGTPHATWPNTYVADLGADSVYLTAGFSPPAPERMSITASYAGEPAVTSSQVNSTNLHISGGTVVSDSYFISAADGVRRPLTLTGSTNPAVQTTFDRIVRGIAAGKNVAILALNASPSNDGFLIDVGSPSFTLALK